MKLICLEPLNVTFDVPDGALQICIPLRSVAALFYFKALRRVTLNTHRLLPVTKTILASESRSGEESFNASRRINHHYCAIVSACQTGMLEIISHHSGRLIDPRQNKLTHYRFSSFSRPAEIGKEGGLFRDTNASAD